MDFSSEFSPRLFDSKIYDMHNPHTGFVFSSKHHLWSEKTNYQTIDIIENDFFGRMLFIDGAVMITERDEFIYHEMISHIPAFSHISPKKVLVLGGGDGGVLRELSKHKNIEEMTLVEIDQRILDLSREFFPQTAIGLDNLKTKIIIGDGSLYLKKKQKFDIIIADSTDPYGFGENLFQIEFYEKIFRSLSPNGVFVSQTESAFFYPDTLKKIYRNLRQVFPLVTTYWATVPTYPTGGWTFCLCSLDPCFNFTEFKGQDSSFLQDLQYYNPNLQQASFCLPNHIKKIVT